MNFGFEEYQTIQLVLENLSGEYPYQTMFPSVVIVSFEYDGLEVIGYQIMNG